MDVADRRPDGEVVEFHLHRSGADIGHQGRAGRTVKHDAHDAAGDVDGNYSSRPGQEALHLGGTAVDVDLAHIEATDLEHRVPGRCLDANLPRPSRVQLDLAAADASQPAHEDCPPPH